MGEERVIVHVRVGALSPHYEALSIEASKQTTAEEIVMCISEKLMLPSPADFQLAEVASMNGHECKERRLGPQENPVAVQLLWPKAAPQDLEPMEHQFFLRQKLSDSLWTESLSQDSQLLRDYFYKFLYQPKDKEYPDLCQLPELNEETLLENLKARFNSGHIYTYIGSILIAVNPFRFYPIYNPKYVRLYQNRRIGDLPPHIFAIADAAYHQMLSDHCNQCIVISGESGSGKTESTNLLLHHLTALSQKGSHASGVEQTILSAGPVLEAFGNAKTAHNNNSSRFGKFIQVNYKENGMVFGASVQKYLLEKSRICWQAKQERNYHVFYYLLAGATQQEREVLHLKELEKYRYLNQSECYRLEGVDEANEFSRLKQSMEMVGFDIPKQKLLFAVLSAVLLLGNVEYALRKSTYHHDESVHVVNEDTVKEISDLLKVPRDTLLGALTCKRAKVHGETLVIHYKKNEAIAARDALAKCLYGALFDWIVMQVNHSLLARNASCRDSRGFSIGVLDIFGFEDFGCNSFEQFCINYANEQLQCYFNRHVFELEQEEYRQQGLKWDDISFVDNLGCLQLIEAKPNGLLCILDDQCTLPQATNESLVEKFHCAHKGNAYYEIPPRRETSFIVRHYAGKVKYQVNEFREKNLDLMRPDALSVLKSSCLSFMRELVASDPVAVFRWSILRAFFRAASAFTEAGERFRAGAKDRILKATSNHRLKKYGNENSHRLVRRGPEQTDEFLRTKIPLGSIQNRKIFRSSPQLLDNTPELRDWKGHRRSLDYVEPGRRLLDARVIRRASRCITKNKSFRGMGSSQRPIKSILSMKLLVEMNLAGTPTPSGGGRGGPARKQPSTVTAQFHSSLNSLMHTLNTANPFFIRCIKSNVEKIPNKLDLEIIQRQLQYTGMLETVRIRQAGYSVRLSFQEFVQYYRILLPKGLQSSPEDVSTFLRKQDLDIDNYQIGNTKIFFRESEKLKLDRQLHREILLRIVTIQRWFRAILQRKQYLRMREASIVIQSACRSWIAQKQLHNLRLRYMAATYLQKMWRGYCVRRWYLNVRNTVTHLQAHIRGYQVRQKTAPRLEAAWKKRKELEEEQHLAEVVDDVFESKMSSQEDLENGHKDMEEPIPEIIVPPTNVIHMEDSDSSDTQPSKRRPNKMFNLINMERKGFSLKKKVTTNSTTTTTKADIHTTHTISLDKGLEDTRNPLKKYMAKMNVFVEGGKKSVKKYSESGAVGYSESENEDSDATHTSSLYSSTDYREPSLEILNLGSEANREERRQARKKIIAGREKRRSRSGSLVEEHHVERRAVDRRCSQAVSQPPHGGFKEHISVFRIEHWPTPSGSVSPAESAPELAHKAKVSDAIEELRGKESTLAHSISVPTVVTDPPGFFQHDLHRCNRTLKDDRCARCSQGFTATFFIPAMKCSVCKKFFHSKCSDAAAFSVPCERRSLRGRKGSLRNRAMKWTGSAQFTDREDQIISDSSELENFCQFLSKQIMGMQSGRKDKKESSVDKVFNEALLEFRKDLFSTLSVSQGPISIRYKDLINSFSKVMEKVCEKEAEAADAFPKTMGVNAFRGFVEDFLKQGNRGASAKRPNRKKRKTKADNNVGAVAILGHQFVKLAVNIPTHCEICMNSITVVEKEGLVCSSCKLTCHKTCSNKVKNVCCKENSRANIHPAARNAVFGVPLEHLLTDDRKIPFVVDRLISEIELIGLYTEGLYRKCGVASQIRRLREALESDTSQADLKNCPVHVLTSCLKEFLRDMPEPLLTFERYQDFIRAGDMEGQEDDQVECILSIARKLPEAHYDMLERLLFHMSRVAIHEKFNRMGPQQLAVVLSPCLLRSRISLSAQETLSNVSKETKCLEVLIRAKLIDVKERLREIDMIDSITPTDDSEGDRSFVPDDSAHITNRLIKGLSVLPRSDSEEDAELDDVLDATSYGSLSSGVTGPDSSVTSVYHTLGIDYEEEAVMV